MKKKAQIVMADLLFVVIILIILFTVSIAMWNTSMIRVAQKEELINLESTAIAVSDLLVKTKGVPENWEETSPTTIGLSNTSNVLDSRKLSKFVDLNYDDAKRLLGGYDFFFQINNTNDQIVTVDGRQMASGLQPASAKTVVNARRIALLGNQLVFLNLMVWK